MTSLRVTEIYKSVQGEARFTGYPCVFIRLTGCPLRCRWCDTAYAFEGGEEMTLDTIVNKVVEANCQYVELTGGEPLAQEGTVELASRLVAKGLTVMIETGGSEPIGTLSSEVHIIMDLKCPGSGMSDRNRWENLKSLKKTDEIKFVISSREDFDWALEQVQQNHLIERFQVLLSPAFGLVKPEALVEWMLEIPLNWKLNTQIHKMIWHPRTKGV